MKPVVIIGGGFAGIIALKICVENGMEALCYERQERFGGLWRYREHVDEDGVASVTKNTIIDSSKEISSLSDFPPPENWPNFIHNTKMIEYLESYIRANKLEPRIKFNHEILKIQKSDKYQSNGEWIVNVKNKENDEVSEMEARAVLVCTGHHAYPNHPTFLGQRDFLGPIIHSHSLKSINQFEGKRVVVVGVGNSAMDAAAELSFIAKQVYLSTRRGTWIIPRMAKNGYPYDYYFFTRVGQFIYDHFPNVWRKNFEDYLNSQFDHGLYGLKPTHRLDQQHPTLSDIVPARILAGAIVVKGDVSRMTPKGVIFKGDEGIECEVDAVIVCTGYNVKIPFLPDDDDVGLSKSPIENDIGLYERMFPVQFDQPTLAFIGMCQPGGPLFPVMELQARWFCLLMTEPAKRPENGWLTSSVDRAKEVARNKTMISSNLVNTQRHTLEVNYMGYADNLAKKIGCMPNMLKMAITDPVLFYHMLFGPFVPYQFRLRGPHKWSGARVAVLGAENRIRKGFSAGKKFSKAVDNPYKFYFVASLFAFVAVLYFFIF